MKRQSRRWWIGGLALGSLLLAARLALPLVPRCFIRNDPWKHSGLIILFGSNAAGSTEVEGAHLWRAGYGTTLLCVGRPAAWHVTEDAVMCRHLQALKIPAARILTMDVPFSNAPDAGTLREEIRLALPLLRSRGIHSALVVSPELESRRCYLLLGPWRRAGLTVSVRAIPDPSFRAAGWWRRKRDTKSVVCEALAWLTLPFGG